MGYAPPTKFRISTITTTASVGAELNLQVFYDNLSIKKESESTGITYVEYGNRKQDTVYKGFAKKFLINRRRQKPAKRFDNQLTIAYKVSDDVIVNIKVFRNGKIQMTGIKQIEQGQLMVDRIVDIIRNVFQNMNDEVLSSPCELEKLSAKDYKVCLINTDYKVGFEVKRDNLYKVMISDYDNICSYEPCIYPGVKIQYFWNSDSEVKDGICRCSSPCYYKKKAARVMETATARRLLLRHSLAVLQLLLEATRFLRCTNAITTSTRFFMKTFLRSRRSKLLSLRKLSVYLTYQQFV